VAFFAGRLERSAERDVRFAARSRGELEPLDVETAREIGPSAGFGRFGEAEGVAVGDIRSPV
jgi:hypothetical protein